MIYSYNVSFSTRIDDVCLFLAEAHAYTKHYSGIFSKMIIHHLITSGFGCIFYFVRNFEA